jgi:hypothetical protein
MDYEGFFAGEIAGLRREGRYRVFAERGPSRKRTITAPHWTTGSCPR